MMIDNNIMKDFGDVDAQKWRNERYWNEECDNLIKTNLTLFNHLYNTKGGAHKLPGEKIFMSIQEFIAMMSEAGFINDVFTERDVAVSYNLAKMTEIDEVNYDKHMKLYFIEFLEATARCADIMSLPPPKSHEEEWPIELRKDQILAQKMENMLPSLLKICKKEFIERYKFPVRDPETGLLVMASPSKPTGPSRADNLTKEQSQMFKETSVMGIQQMEKSEVIGEEN